MGVSFQSQVSRVRSEPKVKSPRVRVRSKPLPHVLRALVENVQPYIAFDIQPVAPCDPVTIYQLERRSCRYIAGDPLKVEAPFCGADRKPGSSYCAPHHRLCYVPAPTIKRDAASAWDGEGRGMSVAISTELERQHRAAIDRKRRLGIVRGPVVVRLPPAPRIEAVRVYSRPDWTASNLRSGVAWNVAMPEGLQAPDRP